MSTPDWGELLFVATGSIVLLGNGKLPRAGYRATWVPPGVQHEWYLPEASWNRLAFLPRFPVRVPPFPAVPRFEMSPLLRELLCGGRPLPDFTTEGNGSHWCLWIAQSQQGGWPLLMPSEHRPGGAVRGKPWPHPTRRYAWLIGAATSACPKPLAPLFIRQTGQTFGRWLQIMRLHTQ